MIEVIETSEGVEVSEVGDVTVIEVGISGPQGPPGTLIELAEDSAVVVTPLRELDFGPGFAVTTPSPRVGQVALDLSEVEAGGELEGTLDAPTVDATHSGSTHQSIRDEINAHESDVVGAHDGTAIAFVPGHGLVSADVQSAIWEVADEVGAGHPDLATHDALGLATDAELATHAGAADPHPGYLTPAEGNAAYDALGAAVTAQSTAEGYADTKDAAHVAASDPHAGYLKESNTIDFLVGTATGDLAGEIVVGSSPGGELGGSWASPTVDATHSGSTHSAATDTHLADTSDAHDASAISVDSTTLVGTGTDVQAVLEEMDDAIAAGSGAPTGADYLVGTAQGGLSAEIVVGTSPGGELGNTWASPTVNATHSGSSHAGTQAAAEATASAADAAHVAAGDPHTGYELESAHTKAAHDALGMSHDSLGDVSANDHHAQAHAIDGADHTGDIGTAFIENDAVTYAKMQNVGATARFLGRKTAGSGDVEELTGADADTIIGTPAALTTHAAAADPHTGYVLESLVDAAGDLIQGSGDNAVARLPRGASLTDRLVVNGTTLAWVPTIIQLSSQLIVNNSAALVDAAGLSFPIAANEKWLVNLWLLASGASATADHKFGWTYPTSCLIYWGAIGTSAASLPGFGAVPTTTSPAAIRRQTDAVVAGGQFSQHGIGLTALIVNGSNAGTMQLQYAQNTATVENNSLDVPSVGVIWRFA